MNPWGFFIAAAGIILIIAAHKNAQGALLNAVTGKAAQPTTPGSPSSPSTPPGTQPAPPPVGPATPPTPTQPVVFNGLSPADSGSLV